MSVTAPEGFAANGGACGLKDSGDPDLALVASKSGPIAAAGVFTTNKAAAAPVVVSRRHLVESGGRIGAVVLNSGCANAATGKTGGKAALLSARSVAEALGLATREVLVCSTGLIGVPLKVDRLVQAVPELVADLGDDEAAGRRAAEAILTTDTHPKETLVEVGGFRVGGMVKGAGMIGPNMATMLSVLTTDAALSPDDLAVALRDAVGLTFNELIVDGCTSTNDTVVVLASGAAGERKPSVVGEALGKACEDLAEQMADDAEGTTRAVRVNVTGATSAAQARLAARKVASSLLVKASLFGADPYWGRVLSELGSSGADFVLEQTRLSYGGTVVFEAGEAVGFERAAVVSYLSGQKVELNCDLGLGTAAASVLTTDLGHGYIDENMRTS